MLLQGSLHPVEKAHRSIIRCVFSLRISPPRRLRRQKGYNDMITDYNTPNRPVIIGLDHGYGNMKTAHACFQTGVTRHEKEPTFKSNLLFYDGWYLSDSCIHVIPWCYNSYLKQPGASDTVRYLRPRYIEITYLRKRWDALAIMSSVRTVVRWITPSTSAGDGALNSTIT